MISLDFCAIERTRVRSSAQHILVRLMRTRVRSRAPTLFECDRAHKGAIERTDREVKDRQET